MKESHTISPPGWSVSLGLDGVFRVKQRDEVLSAADTLLTIPLWGPRVIESLCGENEKLRDQIERPSPAQLIHPMVTVPRVEGGRIDLWVVENGGRYRIPDVTYSRRLRTSVADPYETGWSVHNNGGFAYGIYENEKHPSRPRPVGWSPIPEWKEPT